MTLVELWAFMLVYYVGTCVLYLNYAIIVLYLNYAINLYRYPIYTKFSCRHFFVISKLPQSATFKILNGMANSVDPDQTAPALFLFAILSNFGVQNFWTFTINNFLYLPK